MQIQTVFTYILLLLTLRLDLNRPLVVSACDGLLRLTDVNRCGGRNRHGCT